MDIGDIFGGNFIFKHWFQIEYKYNQIHINIDNPFKNCERLYIKCKWYEYLSFFVTDLDNAFDMHLYM